MMMCVILHCFWTVQYCTVLYSILRYSQVYQNTVWKQCKMRHIIINFWVEKCNFQSQLFFFWASWAGLLKFFTADYASCDGFYTEVWNTTIFDWSFFLFAERFLVDYNRVSLSNGILHDKIFVKSHPEATSRLLISGIRWFWPYMTRTISKSSWSEVHGKK